ncbi:DUF2155 domain-containing protein [Alkalicaulis satelles]|uniref:DUF2155 domain-containing protein n=2 Tax=Alkalicaulis satelles TaxID=2609175 RepID=A0A5M6ZAK5_9PROT|nr:DUF2155 domain-containing protein [Alkalicaulis satelles]
MVGMIRVIALIVSVLIAAPVLAGAGQAQQSGARELSSRPGSVAILRGLDKVTARTRDFQAPVGEAVQFGALTVTVNYCRKRPPEEPPEVFAFLQVKDRRTDGFGVEDEGERIFSGWMFASSPALNALEHPVYDVWVIDCRS